MTARHQRGCRYAGEAMAEANRLYREETPRQAEERLARRSRLRAADEFQPLPTMAPPLADCPACGMTRQHQPGCRYDGLSMDAAQDQHKRRSKKDQ
jgi:hypothetical protein